MLKKHENWPDIFADKLDFQPDLMPDEQDEYYEDMIREHSLLKIFELEENPVKGNWDLDHLAEIHAFIFKDISSLAGSIRDYKMAKGDTVFPNYSGIKEIFDKDIPLIKAYIEKNKNNPEKFSDGVAILYNAINIAHPFREGNGRSSREFVSKFVQKYNYHIDLHDVAKQDKDKWDEASRQAAKGISQKPLMNIFKEAIVTKDVANALNLFRDFLNDKSVDEHAKSKYLTSTRNVLKNYDSKQLRDFVDSLYKKLNKPLQLEFNFNENSNANDLEL